MVDSDVSHESSASATGEPRVRSVARVIEILSLFTAQHPALPIGDIVTATGLPKTTVLRLLATLEADQVVAPTSTGQYVIGHRFLEWVKLASSLWSISVPARAVLRELADATGETVNLYVRRELHRTVLAQEEGTATVRSVVPVGRQLPLQIGASGRILLSADPTLIRTVCRMPPRVDEDELTRQVAETARRGHAVSHGERERGASSVAAVVRGRGGRTIGALSISGPTTRFDDEHVGRYVKAAVAAADRLTEIGIGPVEALL